MSELYGELTATVDATQVINDVLAPVPPSDKQITETFAGTGGGGNPYTALWLLSYVVDRNAPAALVPTLTVNGLPAHVQIGDPGQATCPIFGIISLTPAIDALITGTAAVPQAGDTLVLTYAYASSGYDRIQDQSSVNAFGAVANQGRFTKVESSGSGLSATQALAIAKADLNSYSEPTTIIEATLEENYQGQGIKKAQAITFSSHRLGLLGLLMLITQPEWQGSLGYDQQKLKLRMEA